jgi:hypothetical protein
VRQLLARVESVLCARYPRPRAGACDDVNWFRVVAPLLPPAPEAQRDEEEET